MSNKSVRASSKHLALQYLFHCTPVASQDTDEKNAHSKEDMEDTKTSLSADEEFLMMLKESGISKKRCSPFYES